MEAVLQYLALLAVIVILLILVFCCICGNFIFITCKDHLDPPNRNQPQRDRQRNVLAHADERGRNNRYNDIFFIEPNSPDAAGIRAQLEKDDKDLPSYDEVMRIANLPTPTLAVPSAVSMGACSSNVNTTNTTLTQPPYTETGPNERSLTPPPYTLEPIEATVVQPIATQLHMQQYTQSS